MADHVEKENANERESEEIRADVAHPPNELSFPAPSVDIIVMQIVYKPAVTLPRHSTKAQKSDKIYNDRCRASPAPRTIDNNK